MELEDARVAVVGLGLIGGSLVLGLRGRCRQLLGVDTDPETVEIASNSGIRIVDLGLALSKSDVLVLATPVRETLRLLAAFRSDPPDVMLLIDVGSTKRQIVEAMEALPDNVPAVGGHPLCGKEQAGFRAAEAALFEDSLFVLTPCARTTPEALVLAEQLASELGAVSRRMEAARHDQLLAAASHLPYLMAVGLMGAAEAFGEKDAAFWDVIASGFLSTSRLAASDLTMMVDILSTNQDMTLPALERAQTELGRIRALLTSGRWEALRDHLEHLQQRRDALGRPQGIVHEA